MRRITVRIIAPAAVLTGIAGTAVVGDQLLSTAAPPPIVQAATPPGAAESGSAPSRSSASAPTQSSEPLGLLRIDFDFERQPRAASNQFAIWVETDTGRFVDTLFVTSWIGHGGWQRRPMSMPAWRQAANWAAATPAQIEAVARPAPATGHQTLYWDGLDSLGDPVPAGDYVLRVEGNLFWEQMVTFDAPITVGGTGRDVEAEPSRNDSPADRMISNVALSWLPGEPLSPDLIAGYTRGS